MKKKKISIIIPHHKEPEEVIHPLLSSIDNQVAVDFNEMEIIITNDVKDCIFANFDKYKNIKDIIVNIFSEKSGPGQNRQNGINSVQGEYIMFCDADDCLYTANTLFNILKDIETGADVYSYPFIEEALINGETVFWEQEINLVWVFSKLYKTSFIKEYNIRFADNMFWNEDLYFNHIFFAHHPVVEEKTRVIYLWKRNVNSLTRFDGANRAVESASTFIDTIDKIIEYMLGLGQITEPLQEAIDVVSNIYIRMHGEDALLGTIKEQTEEKLGAFLKKYGLSEFLCNENDAKLKKAFDLTLANFKRQWGEYKPQENIYEFIKRIS